MFAFRLDQPDVWPQCSIYVKIELFAVKEYDGSSCGGGGGYGGGGGGGSNSGGHYCVRFSLNREVLKSSWRVG